MPRLQRVAAFWGLITLWVHGAGLQAHGQAVALIPIPAPAFNGQTLTVTPAVSADRRYVRLTLNPYFNAINGFSTFSTQLGAVGGGGGGNFNAGMNGVIGQQGVDDGSGIAPYGYFSQAGEMRAGPMPTAAGFGSDPLVMAGGFNGDVAVGWDGWQEGDWGMMQPVPSTRAAAANSGRSVKAASKTAAASRRAAHKSKSRRQTSSSSRQPTR